MRAETGNWRWKNTPPGKIKRLLNLLSNSETLHHLESFTEDETVSFIPKCSGMRREKLGVMLWHLFAGVQNRLLLTGFFVFNIVTNISHTVGLLIRHLPWKTKIQENMALRKYNLMKQSHISNTNHLFSWHSTNAEIVIEVNTCSYV